MNNFIYNNCVNDCSDQLIKWFFYTLQKVAENLATKGLTEEYEIQLTKDAIPYALTTPRHVPLLLMEPIKKELKKMESQSVITKVEGQTNWYEGMVVVPKPNQKVWICVDSTHLNKSVTPDPEKLRGIKDMTEPRNQTDLSRFLGTYVQSVK